MLLSGTLTRNVTVVVSTTDGSGLWIIIYDHTLL